MIMLKSNVKELETQYENAISDGGTFRFNGKHTERLKNYIKKKTYTGIYGTITRYAKKYRCEYDSDTDYVRNDLEYSVIFYDRETGDSFGTYEPGTELHIPHSNLGDVRVLDDTPSPFSAMIKIDFLN